jgi:hypothetical protein
MRPWAAEATLFGETDIDYFIIFIGDCLAGHEFEEAKNSVGA